MRLLVALIALAGCTTPHRFASPDATWRTRTGQAKYTRGEMTLIGETLVSTRAGRDFLLDFRKGPGIPLLTLQSDGAVSRYEGVLARGSWQGAADAEPPAALRVWQRARAALIENESATLRVADGDASVDFRFSR